MTTTTKKMDHVAYPRRLRGKADAELRYTIKDAREAMAANPDGENAGYYADEVSYAAMELKRRRDVVAKASKVAA